MIDAGYAVQVLASLMAWATVGLAGRDYMERREIWQEYSRREAEIGQGVELRMPEKR